MHIRLIAVGQRLPAWADAGCREYVKRLPREWHFELVALKAALRPAGKPVATAIEAEARSIVAAMPPGARRVVLDERGRQLTTIQLAQRLAEWQRVRDRMDPRGIFTSDLARRLSL